MKYKALILIFLSFFSLSYASSFTQNHMLGKDFSNEAPSTSSQYTENSLLSIEIENLEVSSEGMFVNVHGSWVELLFLVRDSAGEYWGQIRSEDNRAPTTVWPCPHCGQSNEFWRRLCKRCGKHPRGPK